MAVVRFAEICDHCGKRSEEYGCWYSCRDCGECVCTACSDNTDEESGKADCKRCKEIDSVPDQLGPCSTHGCINCLQCYDIDLEDLDDEGKLIVVDGQEITDLLAGGREVR